MPVYVLAGNINIFSIIFFKSNSFFSHFIIYRSPIAFDSGNNENKHPPRFTYCFRPWLACSQREILFQIFGCGRVGRQVGQGLACSRQPVGVGATAYCPLIGSYTSHTTKIEFNFYRPLAKLIPATKNKFCVAHNEKHSRRSKGETIYTLIILNCVINLIS